MAMMKMLRSIFSLILVLQVSLLSAQKAEWNGISVGADLSRFVVPFVDSTRYGWEFTGDYEVIKDLFLAAEIGSETTNLKTSTYDYSSSGGYTRIGVDYNYMKQIDKDSKDKMFIGLRYGFTTFYHEANNITINDDTWGDLNGVSIPGSWIFANWVEVGTGMRARLFNNFYLGWSARMRIKLGATNDELLYPYTIPGYGKTWSSTAIGINYSIYYKIPLYKKKSKIKEGVVQPSGK
jgi:hypothetical protein